MTGSLNGGDGDDCRKQEVIELLAGKDSLACLNIRRMSGRRVGIVAAMR